MNCVRNCDDFLMKTYAAVIINRSVKDNYHALIKKKNLGTNGLNKHDDDDDGNIVNAVKLTISIYH